MINFEIGSNNEENYINLYDIEEDIHGNSMFDNNGSDDFYGDDNQENFASDNINLFFEPTINKEDSTKTEAFSTEKTSNSTDVKDEKEKEKENKIFEITKEPKTLGVLFNLNILSLIFALLHEVLIVLSFKLILIVLLSCL